MNTNFNDSSIPYFERIFRGLENDDNDIADAFGHHVHWGYWDDPADLEGPGTTLDFRHAAETMTELVCDSAGIKSGMQILDVGCGFGGTIASLNRRFREMQLCGVNFDGRQLKRAASQVIPRDGNIIEFVEADAADIPLPDRRFDVVLAVESAFHFDREAFFRESKRLLKSGGRLTVSDFVLSEQAADYLAGLEFFSNDAILQSYGQIDLSYTCRRYESLANQHGLTLTESIDITANTMPTYDYLLSDVHLSGNEDGKTFLESTRWLQKASRRGLLQYQILSFEQQS